MNVTANNFFNKRKKFPYLKYLLCSTEVLLDIYQEYVSEIQGNRFVNISLNIYCRYEYTKPCMINRIWGKIQL